jgi:CRISPR-associated protein Csm5
MKYRLEVLTPLLVGDGSTLSPIDYMVWKDQVNVLDQKRIFKLLAKGPRLDNYLTQIRKAEKLDFASWGGFAQNFAGRRIPFEDAAYTAYWSKLRAEHLSIPVFASTHEGPYLPASALRGALRTALLASRATAKSLHAMAESASTERSLRRPAQAWEMQFLGRSGDDLLKCFVLSDSRPAPVSCFKVFMLRTAVLVAQSGTNSTPAYGLGWKQSPRGSVPHPRVEESTPVFAEMAVPGSVFEGEWTERSFYQQEEVVQALRWSKPVDRSVLFAAANDYAANALAIHRRYAESCGLKGVLASLEALSSRLEQLRASGEGCLLCLGWGAGFYSKSAWPKPDDAAYRKLLGQLSYYARAIKSPFPFPKTRRVVFLANQPAALPGWAELSVSQSGVRPGVQGGVP